MTDVLIKRKDLDIDREHATERWRQRLQRYIYEQTNACSYSTLEKARMDDPLETLESPQALPVT